MSHLNAFKMQQACGQRQALHATVFFKKKQALVLTN